MPGNDDLQLIIKRYHRRSKSAECSGGFATYHSIEGEISINFTEAELLARDKTDFRHRLALIEKLRQVPGKESQAILLQMKEKDFVFSVRTAAWHALSEQGIVCPQPKEKSTFVIYLEKISPPIKKFLKFIYDYIYPWRE